MADRLESDGRRSSHDPANWGLTLAVIFLFWTVMAILTASGRVLDPRIGQIPPEFARREAIRPFVTFYFWALLTPGIFWISSRFSIEKANWKTLLPVHILIGLAVAIGAEIFDDFIRAYVLPLPVRGRRAMTFDPLRDIRRFWFLDELIMYIAVLAAGFAREYFQRYRARLEEANRLRAQLAEARLDALRMQLNPHFLFNTLHAVSTLVERDPRGVRRMIAKLSTLLRTTLEGTGAQEVPVREELAFLRDYLDIQKIRFQGRLEVTEHVESEVLDALVPSLILQPLVENAVKHGVSKTEGPGLIAVHAWRQGADLHLSVRDNGPGLSPGFSERDLDSMESGFGLRNTRERLEALYGAGHSLSFGKGAEGGLIVTITLPFHTGADLMTHAVDIAPFVNGGGHEDRHGF